MKQPLVSFFARILFLFLRPIRFALQSVNVLDMIMRKYYAWRVC
jgi:hypothetical protein